MLFVLSNDMGSLTDGLSFLERSLLSKRDEVNLRCFVINMIERTA